MLVLSDVMLGAKGERDPQRVQSRARTAKGEEWARGAREEKASEQKTLRSICRGQANLIIALKRKNDTGFAAERVLHFYRDVSKPEFPSFEADLSTAVQIQKCCLAIHLTRSSLKLDIHQGMNQTSPVCQEGHLRSRGGIERLRNRESA